jgi:HSP20 family molecular chaperone IbpA
LIKGFADVAFNDDQEPVSPGVRRSREGFRVLAVAGFTRDQLDITLEGNQLIVSGKQENGPSRSYLYRGIATRQFQRGFLLADGLTVQSANLSEGLLAIELWRPAPSRQSSKIVIRERG